MDSHNSPIAIQKSIQNLKQRFQSEISRIEKQALQDKESLQSEVSFWQQESIRWQKRYEDAERRYQRLLGMQERHGTAAVESDDETQDGVAFNAKNGTRRVDSVMNGTSTSDISFSAIVSPRRQDQLRGEEIYASPGTESSQSTPRSSTRKRSHSRKRKSVLSSTRASPSSSSRRHHSKSSMNSTSPHLGKSTKSSRLRQLTVEFQREVRNAERLKAATGPLRQRKRATSAKKKRKQTPSKRRQSLRGSTARNSRTSDVKTPPRRESDYREDTTPQQSLRSTNSARVSSAKKRLSYGSPIMASPQSNLSSVVEAPSFSSPLGDSAAMMQNSRNSPMRSRTPDVLRRLSTGQTGSPTTQLSVEVPHGGSQLSVSTDTAEMLHHIRSLKSMLGK